MAVENISLTNLCRVESSTLALWTYPVPRERMPDTRGIGQMWVKEDPEFHVPDVNLAQFMIDSMKKYGDTVALVEAKKGTSYTYAEVIDRVQRLASGLRGLGLSEGDVLCILVYNNIEYPIITYATNLIGGIIQTVSPLYIDDDILQRFQECRTKLIVTSLDLASRVDSLVNKFKSLYSESDLLSRVIVLGKYENFIEYNYLFQTTRVTEPADVNPRTTTAVLLSSSGTTGLPKNVQLSHSNIVANLPQMLYVYRHRPGMCTIVVQAMFHHYGNCGVMHTCLYSGVKLVVMEKYDTEEYIHLIEKYKADILHFIPPIALQLTKSPLRSRADLSSVKFIHSAGGALGEELTEELMKMFNLTFISHMYGLTETGLITGCYEGAFKLGSSGVLSIGTKLKIVSVKTREELSANQTGEILCKGPQVTIGYLNRPDATKEEFDEDGFFKTGDVGYVDDEGFLFVVDRIKDLIKYNVYQVSPAYLEDKLVKHADISDAAVIGIPAGASGELPKAFVVLRQGSNITKEDIILFIQGKQ